MKEFEYEDARFFHPKTGEELNVMYDGKHVFLTFFDLWGQATKKEILVLTDDSELYVKEVIDQFKRKK